MTATTGMTQIHGRRSFENVSARKTVIVRSE
jgi:hypothetical protein